MSTIKSPDIYFSRKYDPKWRFISYWHQINEIITLEPESILEIGKGNGLVSDYLKARSFKIITLDIDKDLKPDTVGSVISLPFLDKTFEVVACFEVLEHLPYEYFLQALMEIHRVAEKHVVLSLPDVTRAYPIQITLPKLGQFRRLISLPCWKPVEHVFDGEHYWEIGKNKYLLREVTDEIRRAGFYIKNTYRVFEAPFHRFFVLNKGEAATHG